MTSTRRIGVWIRVSTDEQVRGESPEHHDRRARAYAEAKGWSIAATYRLDAVSGRSVREHPECQRMLADIASGEVTALIFSNLSRLARNTRELLEFADHFKDHDADLVSLSDEIDTTTPAGRMFFTVKAALAQFEREETASRVAASVPVRARLGKPLGGKAPFGYQWVDKKLMVNPDEAPVRCLIYELFLEHQRKKTVANILNERGYRTRRGRPWSATSIRGLLEDPTPKGLHRANYTRSGPNGVERKPESEWIWNQVEPIVSEELWDACHAILLEQAKGRKPTKRAKHLFTGYAFCHCGPKMYVPSNSPKYVCWTCRNKIPVADLETVFHEQLRGFFLSPDEILRHLEQADVDLERKQALLTAQESEAARLTASMDQVMALYLDGQLSKAGFGERYRPLEEQRDAINDETPRLRGEIDFLRISRLSAGEMVKEAQDLYGNWDHLTPQEKRKIVEAIVERVTVGKGEIGIDLTFRTPASQTMMDGRGSPRHSSTPPTPPTASVSTSPSPTRCARWASPHPPAASAR